MSFPLRRLPRLATHEVIKSMNTREIFLLSLASENSQNLVMSSIPKNSLSGDLSVHEEGCSFVLMPASTPEDFLNYTEIIPEFPYIRGKYENTGFSDCGLYVQCQFFIKKEEAIRKLFNRFSKLFKKTKMNMKFEDDTREEFAMEMIKFAWENGIPLDQVGFHLENASSETIQELLNGCQEHHTSIHIGTKLPEGFKCTPPPGGYKLKSFAVKDARWVNLDDFLQCREVSLWGGIPNWTMEYLNGVFKKIVNLECRIEKFTLVMRVDEPCDFAQMVKGLSESEIEQEGLYKKLQFERKDGLKLLISLNNGYYLKMTTF
ncbi:unnamed protein product [Caenorhabditis brenneri]